MIALRQYIDQVRDLSLVRLSSAALTLWFFVLASGIPLPDLKSNSSNNSAGRMHANSSHVHSQKDRTKPFPCMYSRCGCNTAEQCWRQCCCHDLTSKIKWARANNVIPPDYVLAEALEKGLIERNDVFIKTYVQNEHQECKSTCCEIAAASSEESSHRGTTQKTCSCCHKGESTDDAEATGKGESSESAEFENTISQRGVILLQAMRCKGEGVNMLGFAPMLPVKNFEQPAREIFLIERLVIMSDRLPEITSEILTPPPWA